MRDTNMQAILGYLVILGIAYLLAERKRHTPWRTISMGIFLHLGLALLLLKIPFIRSFFLLLNEVVRALQEATLSGTSLIFGYLGGSPIPFDVKLGSSTFILAFQALPLVLLVSALSALLYHWRILPLVVSGFAWCLQRILGVGGTAGVSTAANIFVGMVEAPLLVKPYLEKASESDFFIIMTSGMATIAGTVMLLYATFLNGIIPDPLGNLIIASILNAPAAIILARLIVPPKPSEISEHTDLGQIYDSPMDALTRGTADGMSLLLNITGMVIVVVALVSLINMVLGLIPFQTSPLTLQSILGLFMAPLAWLLGIPWAEAKIAGEILGTKVALNEFLAYLSMSQLQTPLLSDSSRLILTYALCGFANFQGLAIMLAGLSAMVPNRRKDILGLGLKSILAGFLSSCLTACLVGFII